MTLLLPHPNMAVSCLALTGEGLRVTRERALSVLSSLQSGSSTLPEVAVWRGHNVAIAVLVSVIGREMTRRTPSGEYRHEIYTSDGYLNRYSVWHLSLPGHIVDFEMPVLDYDTMRRGLAQQGHIRKREEWL